MSAVVDVRKSAGFRKLRFESVDDCMAEVRRIAAADERGQLQVHGNWTPGRILNHIAAWIEYAYVGFPVAKPPFFIRWILRLQVSSMLRKGMPRGIRIPGVNGGTFGMDDAPVAVAASRLLTALQRLRDDPGAKFESPAFGPMSHADRIRLNLRHAELHLGYVSLTD